jgi:hypothetical protein
MTGWASSELQFADLGDKRRNKRLVRLVEDLASQQLSQCATSIRKLGCHPGCLRVLEFTTH